MEISGVYGVRISGAVSRLHNQETTLNLAFSCNPEMTDMLLQRMLDEIKKLWEYGPTQEEINQFKEKNRVSIVSTSKNNATILTQIMTSVRAKTLPDTIDKQLRDLELVNSQFVIDAAHLYLNPDEGVRFILMPIKKN